MKSKKHPFSFPKLVNHRLATRARFLRELLHSGKKRGAAIQHATAVCVVSELKSEVWDVHSQTTNENQNLQNAGSQW